MKNILRRNLRSLYNLESHVIQLESIPQEREDIQQALQRGFFRPEEEERLRSWFIRFLTIRESLWEIIDATAETLQHDINLVNELNDWRSLIIGYVAASLLVRMDHFLVDDVATHKLTQRKLNERFLNHRVQRKQYTRIFKALTDPSNVLLLLRVITFFKVNQDKLNSLRDDEIVGDLVQHLSRYEQTIDPGKRRYLKRRLRYRWHAFRRRFATAKQNFSFVFLEQSGRVISDLGDHRRKKRVTDSIRTKLAESLQPGDVIVTRHERVASNLFLPGYWPHCALYIGSEEQRREMDIKLDEERSKRWIDERCVLEALKDGVRFRPLSETLAVDAIAIVRPNLAADRIAHCIERVCEHEGKGYNFDFDFFRSDKLVCTEVVYRAYDGIDPVHFTLQHRAGRPTLSAEDILDMTVDGEMFSTVAVFGAPRCRRKIAYAEHAQRVLERTY